MELYRETRWSRNYRSKDSGIEYWESKFSDGSATITLEELAGLWPKWDASERMDFAHNVGFADKGVLPDLLRFIMHHGTFKDWACCAMAIAYYVPKEESVSFLVKAVMETPTDTAANLCQGLARTKSPEAIAPIQACLRRMWEDREFRNTDGWSNRVAFNSICCIQNLIQLGLPREQFSAMYLDLKVHPHPRIRSTTIDYLGKYFEGIDSSPSA